MSRLKNSKLPIAAHWVGAAIVFTGAAAAIARFYQIESFKIDAPSVISTKQDIQAEMARVMDREPPISAFPVQVKGALGGTYNVTQCETPTGERFVTGKLQPGDFLNVIRPTKMSYGTSEYRFESADPC